MKIILHALILLIGANSFASRCPVTCQYISKKGIPVAGCAQDSGSAFGKLFKNCLNSTEEVFDAIDSSGMDGSTKAKFQLNLAQLKLDLCLADPDKTYIYCQDNAAKDAEKKMELALKCSIVREVAIFGIPLFVYQTGCEEYAPKY